MLFFFFFKAKDGIRDKLVTGVQTYALPISAAVVDVGQVAPQPVVLNPAGDAEVGPGARRGAGDPATAGHEISDGRRAGAARDVRVRRGDHDIGERRTARWVEGRHVQRVDGDVGLVTPRCAG